MIARDKMIPECIFFGGIPKTIPEDQIKDYFRQFGPLKLFRIKSKRFKKRKPKSRPSSNNSDSSNPNSQNMSLAGENLHRGCGFVIYKDVRINEIVLGLIHKIQGKRFDCKMAMNGSARKKYDRVAKEEKRKVYIGTLPSDATRGKVDQKDEFLAKTLFFSSGFF